MASLIPGYSPPTSLEFRRLWEDGLFVFDTNVLLDLYRYPAPARADMLSVIDGLKDRIWIPHQVAVEFERNRLSVISDLRKRLEEIQRTVESSLLGLKKEIEALELAQRGDANIQLIVKDAEEVNSRLCAAIGSALREQPELSSNDEIRDQLAQLFDGKVGPAPSMDELNTIYTEGQQRYEQKRPPGYKDAAKAQNLADSKYIVNGLQIQAEFGDLIVWKQLIKHATEAQMKCVALVSADKKEDWWYRFEGKTLGPQPALIQELQSEAGVEVFWMFSPASFLKRSKEYVKVSVQDKSIEDIQETSNGSHSSSFLMREVAETDSLDKWEVAQRSRVIWPSQNLSTAQLHNYEIVEVELAVLRWLRTKYPQDKIWSSLGFPDFLRVSSMGTLPVGYEVISVSTASGHSQLHSRVFSTARLARSMLAEGKLSAFTFIIVAPSEYGLGVLDADLYMMIDSVRAAMGDDFQADLVVGTIVDKHFFTINM